MAIMNMDFYQNANDEQYSDGTIEKELYKIAQDKNYDWYADGRWAIIYHMSPLRENILNWYPFKENSSILEVGAGCGALTGLLCHKANRVVALELTRMRAQILYERHQKFENLEVIIADFSTFSTNEKFDFIIINGVLEYAAYMFKDEHPYHAFLKKAKSHLKTHGHILLSIENKLGLKYFCGAREDHTGMWFSGLNGYLHEKVRTFSRKELTDIIRSCGLYMNRRYYPYPDYKFPQEIFTDASINIREPITTDYRMDLERLRLFDGAKVQNDLMKNGCGGVFANSFLFDITSEPIKTKDQFSYIKISANRKAQYRIATLCDLKAEYVRKIPLTPEAVIHLKEMEKHAGKKIGKIYNIECREEDNNVVFPYVGGKSLFDILQDYLRDGDVLKFQNMLQSFCVQVLEGTAYTHQEENNNFKELFGEEKCKQALRWKDGMNIDLIAQNIYPHDKCFAAIDYEWMAPCPIPLEFMLWRFLIQVKNDIQAWKWVDVQSLLNISEDTECTFNNWERCFIYNYVGMKDLNELSKMEIHVNIDEALKKICDENIPKTSLFWDDGTGYFKEGNHLTVECKYFNGVYHAHFDLKNEQMLKHLRWDPLEGSGARIHIEAIQTDGVIVTCNPIGAVRDEDGTQTFYTYDPQYEIFGEFNQRSYMDIKFTVEILDWRMGFREQQIELSELKKECLRLQDINKVVSKE